MDPITWLSKHGALIAEIGFVWLFIQNFLKAWQDAINAEPKDLKPPFGKIVYYMSAIGGYIFAGRRPQAIGSAFILFLMISLCSIPSFAQTQVSVTPISVTSIMDGVTADIGTGYDDRNATWVQTDTVRLLEYKKMDNAGSFSTWLNGLGTLDPRLSFGYSTSNKGVIGGAFNLFVPSRWGFTSPVLQIFSISPFAQYEIFSIGNVPAQTKNSWIFGAYIVKGSF